MIKKITEVLTKESIKYDENENMIYDTTGSFIFEYLNDEDILEVSFERGIHPDYLVSLICILDDITNNIRFGPCYFIKEDGSLCFDEEADLEFEKSKFEEAIAIIEDVQMENQLIGDICEETDTIQ